MNEVNVEILGAIAGFIALVASILKIINIKKKETSDKEDSDVSSD